MSDNVIHDIAAVFNRIPVATYDGGETLPQHCKNRGTHHTNGKQTSGAKRRSQRRFEDLNRFVDATMRDLPRSELLVWLVLFRDAREGVARTSRTDISRRAGVSTKTVTRALASLIKRKLVRLLYRGGLNRGVSKYAVPATQRGT